MCNKAYRKAISVGKSVLRIYLILVLVALFGQRWMMYPAPKIASLPRSTRGKLLVLDGNQTQKVHVYYIPAQGDLPTVVLFHGNAEQLADQIPLAEDFADVGVGVYVVEYPGYGLSSDGTTTEANVYSDAETALGYLEEGLKVSRSKEVLFGRSLGTGVAAEMAVRGYGSRLILVSPYSSMVALASKRAPILPTQWLVLDRYDTLEKAPRIQQPTLIVHGAKDRVIPCEMGKAIGARVPRSREYIVPGAEHNDIFEVGGGALWSEIVTYVLKK